MAGAKKTFKKITGKDTLKKRLNPLPKSKDEAKDSFAVNPLAAIPETAEDVGMLFTPEIPEPEEETIIPIPSERAAELKSRKRRAKAKGSGRSSTILTEGLGG